MENKIEIIKALLKFQEKCPDLELNSKVEVSTKTGGKYTFKYADLPYIVEKIQPVLTECGLVVHFEITFEAIILHLIHISGSELTSSIPLQLGKSPQENGSLITYYKRYLLTSALNLVAEQDDDANVSVGNEIKTWLTESQFKAAMNADIKGIEATLKAFSGNGKAMKKDYKDKLQTKLNSLKQLK